MDEKILTNEQLEQLSDAIRQAESSTSAEICVQIDRVCKEDPLEKAKKIFQKQKMYKTALRNGVLLYVAVESRKTAILGDIGIHQKLGLDFWGRAKDIMLEYFKRGELCEGIVAAVKEIGSSLEPHFERKSNDINELPDEIFLGD